jgi:transcriptional regulator with XRE-family HTH domain
MIHAAECVKSHIVAQVTIATLRNVPSGALTQRMTDEFRNAFLWHLDRYGTKLSELVAATGVSRDALNKLKARSPASTSAENALAIAAFYGEKLEEFIRCEEPGHERPAKALVDLLRPDEERLIAAQIQGILRQRGAQSSR